MSKDTNNQQPKKKGLIGRWIEKIDRKMEQRSKQSPCCAASTDKKKGSSCC